MGAPAAVGPGSKVPVYTLETNQLSIWPARPPSGDTLVTYRCSEPAKTFVTLLPPPHPGAEHQGPSATDGQLYRHHTVIACFDTLAALILTNCLDIPRASDNKSVSECCTLQIRRVSKISMDRSGLHGTNCLDAGSLGEARIGHARRQKEAGVGKLSGWWDTMGSNVWQRGPKQEQMDGVIW